MTYNVHAYTCVEMVIQVPDVWKRDLATFFFVLFFFFFTQETYMSDTQNWFGKSKFLLILSLSFELKISHDFLRIAAFGRHGYLYSHSGLRTLKHFL